MAKTVSIKQLKHMWPIYLLVLPAAVMIATFEYYPAAGGIFHSFFEWNGDSVENFVGLDNYRQVLGSLAHFGLLLAVLMPFLAARAKSAKNKSLASFGVLFVVAMMALSLFWSSATAPATLAWLKAVLTRPMLAVYAVATVASVSIGTLRKPLPAMGVRPGRLAVAVLVAAGLSLAILLKLPAQAPDVFAWLKLPANGGAFFVMIAYSVLAIVGVALAMANKAFASKIFYYAAFAMASLGAWYACVNGLIDAPAALWLILFTLLATISGNLVAKGKDIHVGRVLLAALTIMVLAGMAVANRADFLGRLKVELPGNFWSAPWMLFQAMSAWHYMLIGIAATTLGYLGSFVVPPVRSHLLTLGQQIVRKSQSLGLMLAMLAMLVGIWRMARTSQLPGDPLLWKGFGLTGILLVFNLLKMIPSIVAAVVIHRLRSERWQYLYRVLFVVPMIIPGMVQILIWKFFFDPNNGPLNKILSSIGVMGWLKNSGIAGFESGHPGWLSNPDLVIPALVIWGFPWVGVVGVLVYLAGLQSIGTEIYESAELDGAGSLRKLWNIEIPLMATQIRLMLILMTIGTIQDFNSFLVMLGPEGGPNGVALVPALYMYRKAFFDAEPAMGYACALGVILFFIILAMTMVNNKYVRVEK